jgi:hypothetical protein
MQEIASQSSLCDGTLIRVEFGRPRRNIVTVDFDCLTGNWRITFGWEGRDAVEVDLEDYH